MPLLPPHAASPLPILDSFGSALTLYEGNTPLYHLTRAARFSSNTLMAKAYRKSGRQSVSGWPGLDRDRKE
jgi:hypothetical protein